jgi:hypothetical protein
LTDHVFTGPYPVTYAVGRDARDLPLGDVEPSEIRDLDKAPDHQWREATGEDRERWAAVLAHRERAARRAAAKARGEDVEDDDPGSDGGEGAAGGIESTPDPADVSNSGTGEGEAGQHDETPPGPQPAAPAVIPGA